MVIYDLQCEHHHEFEGWFKNADELEHQQATGLLVCPVCESANVKKKVTAAKLGRKSNSSSASTARELVQAPQSVATGSVADGSKGPKGSAGNAGMPSYQQLQKMLGQVHKFIDSNFTDVGNRFADEALKIHRGEKEAENIRGTASKSELKELADEGVSALPLPPKPVDKGKLN